MQATDFRFRKVSPLQIEVTYTHTKNGDFWKAVLMDTSKIESFCQAARPSKKAMLELRNLVQMLGCHYNHLGIQISI